MNQGRSLSPAFKMKMKINKNLYIFCSKVYNCRTNRYHSFVLIFSLELSTDEDTLEVWQQVGEMEEKANSSIQYFLVIQGFDQEY